MSERKAQGLEAIVVLARGMDMLKEHAAEKRAERLEGIRRVVSEVAEVLVAILGLLAVDVVALLAGIAGYSSGYYVAAGRSVRHNFGGTIDCGDFAREQGVGTMLETARPTRINAERVPRQSRLPAFVVLLAFVVGLAANLEVSSCSILVMGPVASTAHAQPAGSSRLQLRAKIKSAAEKLNDIASAGPDMIRAMFAGKTSSTSVLALNEKSIAAQGELESAVLAAEQGGALSADESKELARLGELAKKTREPVKEDIKTLKSTLNLPIVGGDAAVRLAPKSQQDAAINNVEASKRAVGALVAAIRKLP